MKSFQLLGIKISFLDRQALNDRLTQMLSGDRMNQIATINPEFIVAAHSDEEYRKLLQQVDLATPDGTGIILAARIHRMRVSFADRITGVDLTMRVLEIAHAQKLSVCILLKANSLSSDDTVNAKILELFPGLHLRIFRAPIDVHRIGEHSPHVLFVAFGSPSQEFWIREHRNDLPTIRIAMGVGGTFDFISGKIQRAPAILRAGGLEWVWRLLREPKRLPRILRAVLVFPFIVLTKK